MYSVNSYEYNIIKQNNLQFCKPLFSLDDCVDDISKLEFDEENYIKLSDINFEDDYVTLFLTNILIVFDQVEEYLLDENKITLDFSQIYFSKEYNEFIFTYLPIDGVYCLYNDRMTDLIKNIIYNYYDFDSISKNRIVEIMSVIRSFEYESKEDIKKLLPVFKSKEYGNNTLYSNIEKADKDINIMESSKIKNTLKNIFFSS